MERKQKKECRQPKKELLALYRQCRLLVEAIANRVPADRERYSEITAGFAHLIGECVYGQENIQRVREITEEQEALKIELSALRFNELDGFRLLDGKSRERELSLLIDDENEKRMDVDEGSLYVPLRSLATLETILRVYGESGELNLWKKSVGCSLAILQHKTEFGSDIPAQARAIVFLHLGDDFETLEQISATWGNGRISQVKINSDVFRQLGNEIEKVVESIHAFGEKVLSGKAAEVAERTIELADGLPLDKLERILQGVKKAAGLMLSQERDCIIRLVQGSLRIKNVKHDN